MMISELHQYRQKWHKAAAASRKKNKMTFRDQKYQLTDADFQDWFMKSFKKPSPTQRELAAKQYYNLSQMTVAELLNKELDVSFSSEEVADSFKSDSEFDSEQSLKYQTFHQ